jgi:hypothetical protein
MYTKDRMSPTRKGIIAALAVWAIGFSQAIAATPADPPSVMDSTVTDECQAGLQFGIAPDKIPPACHAHLVAVKVDDNEEREKWEYQRGFLIFSHGALKAIRQLNN